jgi:hypothetical protein
MSEATSKTMTKKLSVACDCYTARCYTSIFRALAGAQDVRRRSLFDQTGITEFANLFSLLKGVV